jgi:hypothetical protein
VGVMRQVQFQPKRLITAVNIAGEPGHYALDTTPFAFENCRERFAKVFDEKTEGFYFRHHPHKGESVAAFVLKTESIIGVKESSKFAETNRPSILWFEPASFWRDCQMKRSLLTILLRCGILYDVGLDNYEEALFGHEYIWPTKRATKRFLFGFTKYVGPDISTDSTIQFRGWKSVFEGKSETEVKLMLIWPEVNAYTPTKEFPTALWF